MTAASLGDLVVDKLRGHNICLVEVIDPELVTAQGHLGVIHSGHKPVGAADLMVRDACGACCTPRSSRHNGLSQARESLVAHPPVAIQSVGYP
jgi:hypothetical protein